jgi:colicin import membrane protein
MQTQYFEADASLKKMFLISFAAHFLIALFFIIKFNFSSNETLIFQSAVRVDMVGLPQKNMPEEVQETPAPSPEPVKPAPAVETPPKQKSRDQAIDFKKKQNSAIDKLKALEAIENLKKAEEAKTQKHSPAIKGNVISPGTAIKGLARGEYDSYIGKIDSHIKKNWLLPEWLARAGLRARVLVKFDEKGFISERKILLSSGNPAYDEAALRAVETSSPFPAPPEKFVRIVAVDGIIFQFPD